METIIVHQAPGRRDRPAKELPEPVKTWRYDSFYTILQNMKAGGKTYAVITPVNTPDNK